MDKIRIDKWLWAARFYKTRSLATDEIDKGRVAINDQTVKASREVKVGDTVKEGDTLCIIEAMKILNEIESDKSGTVKQVLCENGQAVEYGQALYIIE